MAVAILGEIRGVSFLSRGMGGVNIKPNFLRGGYLVYAMCSGRDSLIPGLYLSSHEQD